MNRGVIAAVVAGLLAAAGVAGCSASSGGGASADSGRYAAPASGAAPAAGGAAGNAAAPEAAAADAKAAAPRSGSASSPAHVTTLALIKTASLAVRVARASAVAPTADKAGAIAVAAGGSVYSDDRIAGKHPSAELTLKVPPAGLETTLDRLAGLGKERSRSSSTKDVTSQVADVGSRVASARRSLAQLRTLYASATKVSQVISIEEHIAEREADLESLEAQQRALAAETATATIHLSLTAAEHHGAAPAHHARGGFIGGLTHGWDAFVTVATALVTALGAVLPFLLVVLVLGAIGWRWRHRLQRPRGSRPPALPS
jgi:hypothetical protein